MQLINSKPTACTVSSRNIENAYNGMQETKEQVRYARVHVNRVKLHTYVPENFNLQQNWKNLISHNFVHFYGIPTMVHHTQDSEHFFSLSISVHSKMNTMFIPVQWNAHWVNLYILNCILFFPTYFSSPKSSLGKTKHKRKHAQNVSKLSKMYH